ncbi:MAG TPA: hypothetical protein VEW93_02655 [Acidimicrobiales bacterium]|nr:hypothetical protein [Acidimicrobiales bacterium]
MSRSVPSPRSRRLVLVAVALALVALFGACTHQRQIPDKYGETTEKNFAEGCTRTLRQSSPDAEGANATDLGGSEPYTAAEAEDVCTCTYEGISGEGGIPYERFKEITADREEEAGPLPEEVLTIVERCRSEVRPG